MHYVRLHFMAQQPIIHSPFKSSEPGSSKLRFSSRFGIKCLTHMNKRGSDHRLRSIVLAYSRKRLILRCHYSIQLHIVLLKIRVHTVYYPVVVIPLKSSRHQKLAYISSFELQHVMKRKLVECVAACQATGLESNQSITILLELAMMNLSCRNLSLHWAVSLITIPQL